MSETDARQLRYQFVLYCVIAGLAALFYFAGSAYFLGGIIKRLLRRKIAVAMGIDKDQDFSFDIGRISIAYLSATIFIHNLELKTREFLLLCVEIRWSVFLWKNNVKKCDNYSELLNEDNPYRSQIKFVGLELILYANKTRFDELRNIVKNQQNNNNINNSKSSNNVFRRNINKNSKSKSDLKKTKSKDPMSTILEEKFSISNVELNDEEQKDLERKSDKSTYVIYLFI